MALTDALVKALKAQGATRYSKADGNGLLLDVTPAGVKSWVFRYRLNGKREKVVIGRYPEVSLKEARAERDKYSTMVRAGRSPFMEKKLAREGFSTDPTVKEFAERYYKEQVEKTWKDPMAVRRYLDNEVIPAFGTIQLKGVTPVDVQKLVYRKRDKGHISAAIHLRGVLKRMFDYAVEARLVDSNPAAMVKTRFIGRLQKRARVLTANEIRQYLRTIYQSDLRRQFKLALHILLLTLKRKSELLLARWEHIDLEKG